LLESIPDPVYTVNAKKIITYFNKAAEQLTGLEQNEAVGKKCHDVMQFNLCDKSCTIDAARHEHKTVKQDMVLTKSDRQALDICATASYFSATEGKDAGGIVILRDVSEERSRERELQVQMETITRQNKAIEELSTPIIPIMDHILVLPLIGTVDAQRAREIMRALLAAIRKHRAKVVILDITGVAMIDSMVANHLDRTIAAARLKGARTVVTGISESVAETIVDLGIDWSSIETLSDLQTGLFGALHTLGYQLVQKPASSN
jgi:rsbT co-antagonist protein RsbR